MRFLAPKTCGYAFDFSGRSPDGSFYGLQDAAANSQPANARFALQHEFLIADNQSPGASPEAQQGPASGHPEEKDTRTWAQKYQEEQAFIRDNYYSKERLDHSNFFKLTKHFTGHIKTEDDYLQAMKQTAASLKDPWTEFTSDKESEQASQKIKDGFRYSGIWVKKHGRDTVIENLLYGFPSYKSDLRIGDKLLSINGRSLKGLPISQIEPLLGGKLGQNIKLEI
jgi:C-terminal processing protease CtpA/Prc